MCDARAELCLVLPGELQTAACFLQSFRKVDAFLAACEVDARGLFKLHAKESGPGRVGGITGAHLGLQLRAVHARWKIGDADRPQPLRQILVDDACHCSAGRINHYAVDGAGVGDRLRWQILRAGNGCAQRGKRQKHQGRNGTTDSGRAIEYEHRNPPVRRVRRNRVACTKCHSSRVSRNLPAQRGFRTVRGVRQRVLRPVRWNPSIVPPVGGSHRAYAGSATTTPPPRPAPRLPGS